MWRKGCDYGQMRKLGLHAGGGKSRGFKNERQQSVQVGRLVQHKPAFKVLPALGHEKLCTSLMTGSLLVGLQPYETRGYFTDGDPFQMESNRSSGDLPQIGSHS
jgi:hypothetical protein